MRLLVIGLVGEGNLGDDLISHLLVNEHITHRWPEAEIGILCGASGNPFGYNRRAKITLLQRPKRRDIANYHSLQRIFLSFLESTDLVLIGGGGLFQDSHFRFTVHRWLRPILLPPGNRCEVYAIGVGFGPLNYVLSRWYLKQVLGRLSVIQVRDTYSHNLVNRLGYEAELACDIVSGSSLTTNTLFKGDDNTMALGCSIRPWTGLSLTDLVRLIEKCYRSYELEEVRLFVFEHSKTKLSERQFNLEVQANLLQRGINTKLYCYNHDPLPTFISALCSVNLAIASRLHANILWQKLNIPLLPLSYAPKVRALYEEQGARVIPIDDLRIKDLNSHFQRLDMSTQYELPSPTNHVRSATRYQIGTAYLFNILSFTDSIVRGVQRLPSS